MEVRRGATREVFLIGKFAIKVPSVRSWKMFLHGLLANMQEREWSGFCNRLCPVIFSFCGGFMVVMPRCRPMDENMFQVWSHDMFVDYGDVILPVEYKYDSYGVLPDGKIVAVDYGS